MYTVYIFLNLKIAYIAHVSSHSINKLDRNRVNRMEIIFSKDNIIKTLFIYKV